MKTLLAVDLGVKTGYALYNEQGKLLRYQSHNFGNASRLKNGIFSILHSCEALKYLYLEGGGKLEKHWIKEAHKMGVTSFQLHAHDWRNVLYPQKEQNSGTKHAKKLAENNARHIIKKMNLSAPSSLTHDVAEAIMIGLYGCIEQGWLKQKDFLK